MSAALTSRACLPPMWDAHDSQALSRKLEVSLGLRILATKLIVLGSSDAPPRRNSMIQLEHVASLLHNKLE